MHATDMAQGWLSLLLTLQSCLAWSNPMPSGRYPAKPGAGRFPCRGVVADEPVFERPRLDVGTPLWMCGCRPRRACRELMMGMLRQLGRGGWVSIAPCAAVDACVGSGRTPAQTKPGVGLLALGLRRSRPDEVVKRRHGGFESQRSGLCILRRWEWRRVLWLWGCVLFGRDGSCEALMGARERFQSAVHSAEEVHLL
ncbi:hypothetical protein B0T18DRAFT_170455 [Schizothecium vesticola]|uniref:Secreted protein n=1 Tax=Schizothecium vesticola TaxID=314040 RepID=A0AA40K225_9PEZI|nr:hypothetical protein B0T18DRAFT_170455 [Schizothecium vesticola]